MRSVVAHGALLLQVPGQVLPPDGGGAATLQRIRLGLCVLNLLALLLCAGALGRLWRADLDLSELQTTNTAELLARSSAATLDKVSLSLAAVGDQLEQQLSTGGPDARQLWPLVDRAVARVPELQAIGVFDQAGEQVCGIPSTRCQHMNVADRDYFLRLQAQPAAGPELSGPVASRLDGAQVLVLARSLRAADGSFRGVVIALLPLARLAPLVASASLGPHGVASLRMANGFDLLARAPALPDGLQGAQTAAVTCLMAGAIRSAPASGSFQAQSAADGATRITAYRRLAGYPVYAMVADATDDSLAGWRISLAWTASFLLAFASASLVVARLATQSQRRQARAQRLYDEAPCGYHTLDAAGRYLSVNATQLRWLGRSRDELVGKLSPQDFFTAEGRASFAMHFPQLKQGTPIQGLEVDMVCGNGSLRRVVVNASPVLDAEGRFVSSNSVLHDIDDLHRARQALHAQNAQQLAMLNTDQVGLMVVEGGHITWANAGMDRIFGRCGTGWVGRPVASLLQRPQEFESARQQIADRLAADGFLRRQRQLLRQDGTLVWVDLSVVRLGPGRTYCILNDITPLRQAEEARLHAAALENRNLALAESARLKNQFLANMSHELRTPLNAVIGYAHLLQMQPVWQDDAKRRRFVGQIGESGRQLLALVQQMLDFAKAEAERPSIVLETVQLGAAITEVLAQVEPRHRDRGVTTSVQLASDAHTVHTDRLLLRQMLAGLIDNALKFSHPGGTVVIHAQRDAGGGLCIAVEDHGIGIPADTLDRLFHSFSQLSEGSTRAYGGAGMGLALVRQAAHALGGEVAVRSTPGTGTVFTLTLPHSMGDATH